MLEKIGKTKTKGEQAYEAIKASIIKNELLPGRKISIDSLANSLGISHTPVREAVARLSNDGLIVYESHKKPWVSGITANFVRQVYEVRKLLEPHLVGKVIAAIPQNPDYKNFALSLRAKATKVLETQSKKIDINLYLEIDLQLNELLVRPAQHTVLGEIIASVNNRSLRLRSYAELVAAGDVDRCDLMHCITNEHYLIIASLLQENTAECKRLVRRHLKAGELRTLEAIKRTHKNRASADNRLSGVAG